MGARSRRKGSAFERRVAAALSAWAGEPGAFRRTPLSGGWDHQRAPGDIQGPPWWRLPIECKDRKGWSWEVTMRGAGPVWDWWTEAEAISGILVVHAPRSEDWLLMPETIGRPLLIDHLKLLQRRALLTAPERFVGPYGTASLFTVPEVLKATDPAWWREIGTR